MNINMETLAIILSAIAIIITFINLIPVMVGVFETRKRNRLDALPMPAIEFEDYTNKPASIAIKNHGYGPVRILSVAFHYNGEIIPSSFKMIGDYHSIKWHEYTDAAFDGKVILPKEELILLNFTHTKKGNDQEIELRKKLSEATLVVHYSDIFNSNYKPLKRSCQWFGRNL